MIEAFSTPAAKPPAEFNRLRRELHDAAGPERLAESRALDTLAELRERADIFRANLDIYAGTGLGDWYMTLASRFDRLADQIERDSQQAGVIGGAA